MLLIVRVVQQSSIIVLVVQVLLLTSHALSAMLNMYCSIILVLYAVNVSLTVPCVIAKPFLSPVVYVRMDMFCQLTDRLACLVLLLFLTAITVQVLSVTSPVLHVGLNTSRTMSVLIVRLLFLIATPASHLQSSHTNVSTVLSDSSSPSILTADDATRPSKAAFLATRSTEQEYVLFVKPPSFSKTEYVTDVKF